MIIKTSKKERARKRHNRIRKKISGTKEMPRLSLYKSNKHIYAQLIDDVQSSTLAYCSTLQPLLKKELKATWSKEAAKKIGELIAKDALSKGIKKVVFDRGGNRYHGKVLAFAEGARASGLEF
ncbi:MAG: 50S ribosomal protein L18 [Candidatus Melainabacteria bacterium]|nr:50S ribosomal protein L18 [Candidatus Melainabacteria bacterium]